MNKLKIKNSKLKVQKPSPSLEGKHKARGFTLLELIIAISVLAILTVMLLFVINPVAQFQKANDARRKSDLSQIQKAIEQYYQDFGKYPASLGSNAPSSNYYLVGLDGTPIPWGTKWQPYMNLLPKDPSFPQRTYAYYTDSSLQTYWLYASLERGKLDPSACIGANATCSNANHISADACGVGVGCNFGISSPNTTP